MEPMFRRKRYKHLVPQVVIEAGDRKNSLLEAGHRAADAIVRFSTLGPSFTSLSRLPRGRQRRTAAKIAPTSLVFGAWDSRATQVKLPRIVRSVIRAYNVKERTRSAQYSTIAGEILAQGEPRSRPGAQGRTRVGSHASRENSRGRAARAQRRDPARKHVNLAALRALADRPMTRRSRSGDTS
jgi:CRISPR-associated protein Csb1